MNILSIENIAKTLNDEPLFENVTLGLEEGEQVGIVGKNGAGKSTFLRVLSGEIYPDEGNISCARNSNIVQLEQRVSFPEGTTLEEFLYLSKNKNIELLKRYNKALEDGNERLYNQLYTEIERDNLWDIERAYYAVLTDMGENIDSSRRMDSLSGGQQKKASIARAIALRPTILLLDEPTNDLDVATLRSLEEGLQEFGGCVMVVSHDRWFLDRIATHILAFEGKGKTTWFEGGFSDYHEMKEKRR